MKYQKPKKIHSERMSRATYLSGIVVAVVLVLVGVGLLVGYRLGLFGSQADLTAPAPITNQATVQYCTAGEAAKVCDPSTNTFSGSATSNLVTTQVTGITSSPSPAQSPSPSTSPSPTPKSTPSSSPSPKSSPSASPAKASPSPTPSPAKASPSPTDSVTTVKPSPSPATTPVSATDPNAGKKLRFLLGLSGVKNLSGITLEIIDPITNRVVAQLTNLSTSPTGELSTEATEILNAIKSGSSNKFIVTLRGYLPVSISSLDPLNQTATAEAVFGDFDGDKKIKLSDIVRLIRAYNGASETSVTDVVGGRPTLKLIVDVIRNANLYK